MQTKDKKKKREILQTPPGTAVWPALNKPTAPYEGSSDKTPVWKTGLRLKMSDPAVQVFMAELQRRYDANLEAALAEESPKDRAQREKSKRPDKGADLPWKEEVDDNGQPTGTILLNLKQKSFVVRERDGQRFDFFVDLFDAKGNRIDRDKVKIGGGSTIVCAIEVGTFNTQIGAGLSLRLNAVQVLERMENGGRDAAGYGFKPQDGFSVDDEPAGTDAAEAMGSPVADDGSI